MSLVVRMVGQAMYEQQNNTQIAGAQQGEASKIITTA